MLLKHVIYEPSFEKKFLILSKSLNQNYYIYVIHVSIVFMDYASYGCYNLQ